MRCTSALVLQAAAPAGLGKLLDSRWLAWAEQLAAGAEQQLRHDQPPAAASRQQPSAMDTGMLDMSAFGFGGEPEPPQQQQQTAPTSPASALESGMLDMSAFGMSAEPEPPAQPQPQPAAVTSALESGMLDMSAFGLAAEAEPPRPPRPQLSAAGSSVHTGMLDMSAFGLAVEPQPLLQRLPSDASPIDSGMLDMSAFGLSTEPEPAAQRVPQESQAAPSALDSGRLDMSAFGLAPAPSLPPVATRPAPSSALDTGQLDMSAFGMGGAAGGGVSRDAAEQPPTPGRATEPCRGSPAAAASANGIGGNSGGGSSGGVAQQQQRKRREPLPQAAPLAEDELAALRKRLGMAEQRMQEAAQRADASAFSLLRLDAPETALQHSLGDADAHARADANGGFEAADGGGDGSSLEVHSLEVLPGLTRQQSLRVLALAQLAADFDSSAGGVGGTAAQFLSGGGRFGGGGHGVSGGGAKGAALDAAGRRAALAFQIGLLRREDPAAQQAQQVLTT